MKWGGFQSIIFFLVLVLSLASCEDDYSPCIGEKEFVYGTRDAFFTQFSRFDTAVFELKLNGLNKSIRTYLIGADTLFTKDKYGCDNNCTYYETEVLMLERLDELHSITFSNNACNERLMAVNGKEFNFRNDTIMVTKNDSIVLSLDSGLIYYTTGRNYILKRIR